MTDNVENKMPSREINRLIGLRIRQKRKLRGISQVKLGTKVGCSYQQIQKYETNRNRIPSDRLIAIARSLGTHVTELLPSDVQSDGVRSGGEDDSITESELRLLHNLRRTPHHVRDHIARLVRSCAGITDPDAE